jgi:hypothetical protein
MIATAPSSIWNRILSIFLFGAQSEFDAPMLNVHNTNEEGPKTVIEVNSEIYQESPI